MALPSIKGVIFHSLESSVAATPAMAELRRQNIQGMPAGARRLGALALHDLALRHPRQAALLLGMSYQPTDMEYVGHGCHSMVWRRTPDEVVKVNSQSLLLKPEQKERFKQKYEARHQAMADYLKDFVLYETTTIDKHPVFISHETVQTIQPYRKIVDPNLAGGDNKTLGIVTANVAHVANSTPGILVQLQTFVDRSRALYANEGLMPDVAGSNNLVLDTATSQLLMIDGQPIGKDVSQESTLQTTMLNMDYLEAALEAQYKTPIS
jgi:hypothetical protein